MDAAAEPAHLTRPNGGFAIGFGLFTPVQPRLGAPGVARPLGTADDADRAAHLPCGRRRGSVGPPLRRGAVAGSGRPRGRRAAAVPAAARRHVFPPVGTRRIGGNPGTAVAGTRLRVHGVDRLRDVDTSVRPAARPRRTPTPPSSRSPSRRPD
ncbi:GMC oxidoreductase [Streptomyces sp. NPDC059718]